MRSSPRWQSGAVKFGMFQDSPELGVKKAIRCGSWHRNGTEWTVIIPEIPGVSPKVGRWGEPLFDKLRVLVFVVYGGISSSQKRFFERQLGEDFRNVGCLDDIKTWPKTVEGVSVSGILWLLIPHVFCWNFEPPSEERMVQKWMQHVLELEAFWRSRSLSDQWRLAKERARMRYNDWLVVCFF